MSNPPAPRSTSRERMLETAIDLMRGFGLSGAGINDLVRESGAPKGSVYHFFPGGKFFQGSVQLFPARFVQVLELRLKLHKLQLDLRPLLLRFLHPDAQLL